MTPIREKEIGRKARFSARDQKSFIPKIIGIDSFEPISMDFSYANVVFNH